MQIILFNGPPRSGKDTAAKVLIEQGYHHYKFAQPIDDAIMATLPVHQRKLYQAVVQDPHRKDAPLFNGKSSRQLKIAFSETFVKPNLGDDFFGVRCAADIINAFYFHQQEIAHEKPCQFVVSDCGFQQEFDAFCHYIKTRGNVWWEIILVQVHRQGRYFSGDSRGYVVANGLTDLFIKLANDGSVDDLRNNVMEIIR